MPQLTEKLTVMKIYKDTNEKELTKGDIVNLHQTVNGQNLFVAMNLNPLTMVYAHDLLREYEYGHHEMLSPSKFTGETDWEIVNNIYNLMPDVSW
jgi:hypothetical protein